MTRLECWTRPVPVLAAAAAAFVFGIYLNPLHTTAEEAAEWAFLLTAATAFLLAAPTLMASTSAIDGAAHPAGKAWSWALRLPAAAAISAEWFRLYGERLRHPALAADDPFYFADADRMGLAVSLLTPFNEHVCLFARAVTWGLARGLAEADRPAATGVAIAVMVAISCLLIGRLAATLAAAEWPGWLAAALFACSYSHAECLGYYAAALWLPTLWLTVGAVLALEWRSPIGDRSAALCCLLGPVNFSIGVLVPLTALAWAGWSQRRPMSALVPFAIAGGIGVLVAGGLLATRLADPAYYAADGHGFRGFDPAGGFVAGCRLTIDRLLLTNLRFPWVPVKEAAAAELFAASAIPAAWWLRRRRQLAPLLPLLLWWVLGYGLTLPLRTWAGYRWLAEWTRYQLFPQAGLTVFLAVALHAEWRRLGRWWSVSPQEAGDARP